MAGPTDRFLASVMKAGLLGMARNLAIELAPAGIRVNSVAPGFIDTPELQCENAATSGQIDRFIAAAVPLARIGTSRECASAILYLASDEAAYCSGTVLGVDGGSLANASWGSR
jgi:NAD(P)-dependent dehydrogenase (short-subunit alcohol dehydrogenase family)